MLMPDVNVLVQANRVDLPDHQQARSWLDAALRGREPVAISELVLSGYLRIVTNRRVLGPSVTSVTDARAFATTVRSAPAARSARPAERHWDIFLDLVDRGQAVGPDVADAYHAALAIETGSELITYDRGFARFPGLRFGPPV